MRGAECWTDHRLVRSKLSMHIQASSRGRGPSTVKKLNRLKDPTVSSNFNKALDVALDQMSCLTKPGEDANQKWAHLRDTVYATAASTLGYKKRKNQDWFDENDGTISFLLESKRIAFVKTLKDSSPSVVQAHKDTCSTVQAELRKMQDNWWSNKADELQDLADRHDSRFNDGMMGRVCADGKESDWCKVTANVKQGCTITLQSIFCCNAKRSYGGHATGSDYKIPERKYFQPFQAESLN